MIWVIGCNGMLGTQLSQALEENKVEFEGTDRNIDITDIQVLEEFAKGKKIDYIVNCSAYTAVDKAESEAESAERINVLGVKNIAEVAKKIGAKLIHISTDYVFDGKGKFDSEGNLIPYNEEDSICPIGVYGKTKAEGEKEIISTLSDYYILRTAWLYGFSGKNFVYTMIKLMKNHDSIKVVADQRGTPTFCGTLVNAIVKILLQKDESEIPFGIYHVTDEGKTTWFDFAEEIQKQAFECGILSDMNCKVNSCTTEEYPTPAKRPAFSVLDKTKIQKILKINLPQWQESLKEFLKSKKFDKMKIE